MLHANICDSAKLELLGLGAEVLWYRLLTKVDDYGNWYWDSGRFKTNCFGKKTRLNNRTIKGWMEEIKDAGLVAFNYPQLW
jgi:hypothetical protein